MDMHIALTFGTTLGRNRTLRINNINDSVNDSVVRNAMSAFISSNAVVNDAGRINSIRSAALVERHVTPIELP